MGLAAWKPELSCQGGGASRGVAARAEGRGAFGREAAPPGLPPAPGRALPPGGRVVAGAAAPWGRATPTSRGARCPRTPSSCRPAGRSTRRNTPIPRSTSPSSPRSAPSDGRWARAPTRLPGSVHGQVAVTRFGVYSRVFFLPFSCPQTMSAKEKSKFEDMAKSDKARYDREMKNYVPPKGDKKGKKKDPNAPKRPP